MCRVRNKHTGPPWTTAFICITVDDSCLDEDGKFVDEPMTVRMVQWQPYRVKEPFDPKTPVCASCKRTNRTKSFCRERHQHRKLPWCTVYVLLSTLDSVDPSTVVAGPTKKDDVVESSCIYPQASPESTTVVAETSESKVGDDINDIADSRTFLAKVSVDEVSIHWLEVAEYDPNQIVTVPGDYSEGQQMATQYSYAPQAVVAVDPSQLPVGYYQPAPTPFNPTQQQQQEALKSRQQYFFQIQQQYPPNSVVHWPQHPQAHPQQQHAPMPAAAPGYQQHLPAPGDPLVMPSPTAGEAAAARQHEGDDETQQWYFQGYVPAHPNADDPVFPPEPESNKRARIL